MNTILLGEFLCTGQIYLATIIAILHTEEFLSVNALIYFIVYNIALIIPLIIISFIIYKTKGVFETSEMIRVKMPYIKLANSVLLLVIGILIIIL